MFLHPWLRVLLLKGLKLRKKSFVLWHKHLGHISREMVERLTKTNILPSLNFDDLGLCGLYKGKLKVSLKPKRNVQLEVQISYRLFIQTLVGP